MSIIDDKFKEWRVLLEKYSQAELNSILWKMGNVIGQADHARLFPKVFIELAQKISSGKVDLTAMRKPVDVDQLIHICDGIMINESPAIIVKKDGVLAVVTSSEVNITDLSDAEYLSFTITDPKSAYYQKTITFQKIALAKGIRLGDWVSKIEDTEGVKHTVCFCKYTPIDNEDLPYN